MSALANILLDDGYLVRGSDKENYIHSQERLLNRGVIIDLLESKEYIDYDLVIVGHSFMKQELIDELNTYKKAYFEYHDFLSYYIDQNKLISICGSHGKTTLTKMLASTSLNASFLIGDGSGKKVENEDFFFLESCEYQEHFLLYNPKEIIITNIDYDHVDYFANEESYINAFDKFSCKANKVYCLYQDAKKINCSNLITYGLDSNADYSLKEKSVDENNSIYKIYFKTKEILSFEYERKPSHFLELLLSLFAFYHQHNYDLNIVLSKLKDFNFPYQRFNVEEYKNHYLISDYSHHPSQIKYNLEQLQFYYKNHKKIAIFRPDRTSRLIYFKDRFIDELNKYDYAFVLPLNNTESTLNHSAKELENDKIISINKIEDLFLFLPKNGKYCFSLMSSKNLKEEIHSLKEILDDFN